uniref:Multidrug transporter n=1 Tax=Neobacillus citreus TaxID=2833578 RepID=A0A942Y7W3_9BACI
MTTSDRDHLDDGVDMTFEERRQDTLRRMSGSDEHDADPRVEVSEGEHGDVRIDVADSAAVRPGDAEATDPRTDEHQDPTAEH